MPAGQHSGPPDAVKQVLQAHRAVVFHAVGHADVVVVQVVGVAAAAGVAVEEVVAAPNAADAALVAVELRAREVVVEELALHARPSPKRGAAWNDLLQQS